jgi:hypothetical protein
MLRASTRLPRSEGEVRDISIMTFSMLLTFQSNGPPPPNTQPKRKRKSPDGGLEYERRSSPFDRLQESRTPSVSRSPSVSSAARVTSPASEIYNGVLDADEYGRIFCRQVSLVPGCLCIFIDMRHRRQVTTYQNSMFGLYPHQR